MWRSAASGRQAAFGSPFGPPQSGQRASGENHPTLAGSGVPLFGARAWSAAHEWCAVVAFKRRSSDSVQRCMGEWRSICAICCGAAAERLLVGSRIAEAPLRRIIQPVSAQKTCRFPLRSLTLALGFATSSSLGLWPVDAGNSPTKAVIDGRSVQMSTSGRSKPNRTRQV